MQIIHKSWRPLDVEVASLDRQSLDRVLLAAPSSKLNARAIAATAAGRALLRIPDRPGFVLGSLFALLGFDHYDDVWCQCYAESPVSHQARHHYTTSHSSVGLQEHKHCNWRAEAPLSRTSPENGTSSGRSVFRLRGWSGLRALVERDEPMSCMSARQAAIDGADQSLVACSCRHLACDSEREPTFEIAWPRLVDGSTKGT